MTDLIPPVPEQQQRVQHRLQGSYDHARLRAHRRRHVHEGHHWQHDASERAKRAGDVPTLLTGQISSPLEVDWRDTFALYLGYSVEDFPGGIDPQEQIYSHKVTLLKTQEV